MTKLFILFFSLFSSSILAVTLPMFGAVAASPDSPPDLMKYVIGISFGGLVAVISITVKITRAFGKLEGLQAQNTRDIIRLEKRVEKMEEKP